MTLFYLRPGAGINLAALAATGENIDEFWQGFMFKPLATPPGSAYLYSPSDATKLAKSGAMMTHSLVLPSGDHRRRITLGVALFSR